MDSADHDLEGGHELQEYQHSQIHAEHQRQTQQESRQVLPGISPGPSSSSQLPPPSALPSSPIRIPCGATSDLSLSSVVRDLVNAIFLPGRSPAKQCGALAPAATTHQEWMSEPDLGLGLGACPLSTSTDGISGDLGSHVSVASWSSAAGRERRLQESSICDHQQQLLETEVDSRPPLHVTNLPAEIQLLIVLNLDFGDIESLRRTSTYFRRLASPKVLRGVVGKEVLDLDIQSHCSSCLRHDTTRSRLLRTYPSDPGYPLSSLCVECAIQLRAYPRQLLRRLGGDGPSSSSPILPAFAPGDPSSRKCKSESRTMCLVSAAGSDPGLRCYDAVSSRIRPGHKMVMGNGYKFWPCRWCGWPVFTGTNAPGYEQFHSQCRSPYDNCLLVYALLRFTQ